MSAKEMFEDLGFELVDDYPNFICWEYKLGNGLVKRVDIRIRDCETSIYAKVKGTVNSYGSFNTTPAELKAIQKQIEELGWEE